MKCGIIIKHKGMNKLLIIPRIDHSALFKIVQILNCELSQNLNFESATTIIEKYLSEIGVSKVEWIEIVAEIN